MEHRLSRPEEPHPLTGAICFWSSVEKQLSRARRDTHITETVR